MDSITHLVAGALTPMAFTRAPKTRLLTLYGIICGQFPDIDVIAGKSPESILDFHRGITHALVLQPLVALGLALVFHRMLAKRDDTGAWTFGKTWSVALTALLIHLFLDCMTTFGTQIFLPFSDLRVALPAMYIVDLTLTLPVLAIFFYILKKGGLSPRHPAPEKTRTRLARAGLLWLIAYPLLALSLNYALAANLEKRLATPGNERGIHTVELSPEPFAPLNWKIVAIAPDAYYMGRLFLPAPETAPALTPYQKPDPALWDTLRREVNLFRLFDNFATYPFQTVTEEGNGKTYTFADVRYEATLPELMNRLGRGDGIFLAQARVAQGKPEAYRFLYRGRDAAAIPWEKALPPKNVLPQENAPDAPPAPGGGSHAR